MTTTAAIIAMLKVCAAFVCYFASALYLVKFVQAYRAGYAFNLGSIIIAIAALFAVVGSMIWLVM